MDLVYVPEVLNYGFLRSQPYRDYEQPWNTNYFNNGRSSQNHCQRLPQQQHHEQKQLSKESCHLCRESKRRSLAAYIRGKSRRGSCQEIHEEEEEQDVREETENTGQQLKAGKGVSKTPNESKETKETQS
ncbi:uncharacterized protein LOC117220277 [Megalopta genalis]|uniref:uncharacterized protein LOC117220277 n=1 Tax=Megalopta genalis TaxID=115081 RepID=UPI0014432346|nr:uncharacterized protein LOC117220277 [Megalopta genalis]